MAYKRYTTYYESDHLVCGSNVHTYGNSNTLKTAKSYIDRCRRESADEHPRNFKITDCMDEDADGFAKVVYEEA